MTRHELLDHFAGIALAELVKRDNALEIKAGTLDQKTDRQKVIMETTAQEAYSYAIMMMRNRDKAHDWLNKQTKEPV